MFGRNNGRTGTAYVDLNGNSMQQRRQPACGTKIQIESSHSFRRILRMLIFGMNESILMGVRSVVI